MEPEVVDKVPLRAAPEQNVEPEVVDKFPLKAVPELNVELEAVVLVKFVPDANLPNAVKQHQDINNKDIAHTHTLKIVL